METILLGNVLEDPGVAVSLTTYLGLAALAALLIQGVKKVWKGMKGKEGWFALGLPLIIGIAVKAIGIGFKEASWVAHIVALIGAGIGSGLVHDKIGGPIKMLMGFLTKKKEGKDSSKAT